jgi:hypothetical protein
VANKCSCVFYYLGNVLIMKIHLSNLTRQMHTDRQKLRCLALQLLAAGDLRR